MSRQIKDWLWNTIFAITLILMLFVAWCNINILKIKLKEINENQAVLNENMEAIAKYFEDSIIECN